MIPQSHLHQNLLRRAIATLLTVAAISTAPAADTSALLDALIRKGVLTDQEAAAIQEESAAEDAKISANKIKLSNSLTELKLYGDVRLRYQYENRDAQVDPLPVGTDGDRSPSGSQQSRWRFRLRVNADFKLGSDFFGGVELSTARASDSGNQTFEDGFADYPIFISRAFLGWTPSEWLTVTAGKVPNPFYTTELVWDADINPTGLTESISLHQLFATRDGGGGLSKDGKTSAPTKPSEIPWELTLNAGQFIFDDNAEGAGPDNDLSTDAYLFQTQLVGSYKFGGTKVTLAPGWLIYVNGALGGLDNANRFEDNARVSGATRNLNLLLLPGEVAFKVAGLKTKFLWDVSYNIEGRQRVEDIYGLVTLRSQGAGQPLDPDDFDTKHTASDDFAFLAGVQVGENKKKGDWSVLANYRQIGIGSIDPNLNDSDWGQSELNTRGFKVSAAYSFTDFLVGALTYQYAWNLRDNLVGGEATTGNAISDANVVQTLQVDLSVKC